MFSFAGKVLVDSLEELAALRELKCLISLLYCFLFEEKACLRATKMCSPKLRFELTKTCEKRPKAKLEFIDFSTSKNELDPSIRKCKRESFSR